MIGEWQRVIKWKPRQFISTFAPAAKHVFGASVSRLINGIDDEDDDDKDHCDGDGDDDDDDERTKWRPGLCRHQSRIYSSRRRE